MAPNFLVPETVVRENGQSTSFPIGDAKGCALSLTLGITRSMEQESLDLSIWGSADGAEWGSKPLMSFPQKFYCGTYPMTLDLAANPDIAFLRADWKVNRWGRGEAKPIFEFYVFAEPAHMAAMAGR